MRTDSANNPRTQQTQPVGRPAESLGTQIAAALGYTVVVVAVALFVFGSFTDDFGLAQAEVACLPVAAACLAAIRRKGAR